MRSMILIFVFALASQAKSSELAKGSIDTLPVKYLERALKADNAGKTLSPAHIDMDGTMLGKAGQVASPIKGPLVSRSASLGIGLRPLTPSSPDTIATRGGKRDMLTGRKRNKANSVSFSNKHTRKWQNLNVHDKFVYWPEMERSVKLRISTRTMRTINKNGLQAVADNAGIDLKKLPFRDYRPARLQWLKENPMRVPLKKEVRAKLESELAAGKKPLVPRYVQGRIFWIKDGEEKKVYDLMAAKRYGGLSKKMAPPTKEKEELKIKVTGVESPEDPSEPTAPTEEE